MSLEDSLRSRVREHCDRQQLGVFERAIGLAQSCHAGQMRKTGEPYLDHVLEVARALFEKYSDFSLLIAGILHDTVEDSDLDIATVYEQFGDEVGFLVDAANKKSTTFYLLPERRFTGKTERLLWAGIRDVRALLLKIADREHNLQTISALGEHKQVRMSFETQAIFTPLKNILAWDECCDVDHAHYLLQQYLKKQDISQPLDFKQILFSASFGSFDEGVYQMIYRSSDKIVWEIDDKEYYRALCRTPSFAGSHDVVSLSASSHNFHARFTFSRAFTLERGSPKLMISSFIKK